MRSYVIAILATVCIGPVLAANSEPAPERSCFTTAETREKILAHGLSEPFHVMHGAATRLQAQVIGVKLCRWREDLVYELSLLRHDGHIIHISVDAKTGQPIGSKTRH